MLVTLMIEDDDFAEKAEAELDPAMFRSEDMREVFKQVVAVSGQGKKRTVPAFLNRLNDEKCREQIVAAVAEFETIQEKGTVFDDCLKKIKKNRVSERLEELRRLILEAERRKADPQVLQYTKEYRDLLRQSRTRGAL